jgi:predicted RNase H-like nuclease (RuvC/YqgF family)
MKYAEEPATSPVDDCECKKLSAVADVLKKFITQKKTKKWKPEATSGSNTKVDCETQTEENSRQRVSANADRQKTLRRLEEKNRQLSMLVEQYQRKIFLLNEQMEHLVQDRKSHIHHIEMKCEEANQRQLRKMRYMRDELILYKEQLPGSRMATGQQGPSRDMSSD